MSDIKNLRNIAIIAHVDHGKTTLVDKLLQQSGALDYCRQRAHQETDAAIQALNQLPESPYRLALYNLAQLALHRIQ